MSDHGRDSCDSDDIQEVKADDPVDLATQTVNCHKYLVFEHEASRPTHPSLLQGVQQNLAAAEEDREPWVRRDICIENKSAMYQWTPIHMGVTADHSRRWKKDPLVCMRALYWFLHQYSLVEVNFPKVAHFARVLRMNFISKSTFYRHQGKYLIPAIHDAWNAQQEEHWHDIHARVGMGDATPQVIVQSLGTWLSVE